MDSWRIIIIMHTCPLTLPGHSSSELICPKLQINADGLHFSALGIRFWLEVAFVEGLFCTQTVHLGPGLYITVVPSAITRVPLYSCIHVDTSSASNFK